MEVLPDAFLVARAVTNDLPTVYPLALLVEVCYPVYVTGREY